MEPKIEQKALAHISNKVDELIVQTEALQAQIKRLCAQRKVPVPAVHDAAA